MKTIYIIVKKYNAQWIRFNDRKYWDDKAKKFISNIAEATEFESREAAKEVLSGIEEEGIFKIEEACLK